MVSILNHLLGPAPMPFCLAPYPNPLSPTQSSASLAAPTASVAISGSSNQPIYGMHFLSEPRIDPNVHCVDV